MSTPFDLLGIGADADERAIKSAYAKLLRTARPDEDAEGFQRLNEAYQRALQICRARGSGAFRNAWQQSPQVVVQFNPAPPATDAAEGQGAGEGTTAGTGSTRAVPRPLDAGSWGGPASGPHPPGPRPADAAGWQPARQAQSAFDFQKFLAAYRQHAEADDARALQEWLSAEPGLWHLPTKQAVGRHLLKALFENPVPTTEDCLDAMLDFFKLNDALSGVDPIFLSRLKHRAIGEWHARSDLRSLAWQLYGSAASRNLLELRKIRVRCERPFRWPGALWRTLRSNRYANHVAWILLKLCGNRLEDLPKAFDRRGARFWVDAAGRGLNRVRLIIFAVRSAVALTAIPLLGFVVNLIVAGGELDSIAMTTTFQITFGMTFGIVAAAWLWIGLGWAMREFDRLTYHSRMAKAVRIGFTPALCIANLAVAQLMDPALGTVLAISTLLIAIWRLLSRSTVRIGPTERIGIAFFLIFCFSALSGIFHDQHGMGLAPLYLIDCLALAIWAFDMKKLYWRSFAR